MINMDLSRFFTVAALAADAEAPTLFPYPFSFHVTFVIIATLFFGISFAKLKRPYQLILAIAVPFSLLLWVADNNRIFYYAIGVVELLLIAAAFLTSVFLRPKKSETTAQKNDTQEQ